MMDPVLRAREERWTKKLALARSLNARCPGQPASLAVLTLRMPAPLRTSGQFDELAKIVFRSFAEEAAGRGIRILGEEFRLGADGPEGYLAAEADAPTLKRAAVDLEAGDPWGELVDIDVMDSEGQPLGRKELGMGPRACLVCGKEATCCSAGRLHEPRLVAERVREIAKRSRLPLKDMVSRIGRLALTATLLEASTAPKPGLVDPLSPGAHRDMDYFTFLSSAAALGPWFAEFARLGACHRGELSGLLPVLREAGKAAERDMFAATGGVNTHKGLIFSMGLLCASAGRLATAGASLALQTCAEPRLVASRAADIVQGITLRDFNGIDKGKATAGERLYAREGVRGIRGEAEDGFPAVLDHALPRLRAGLSAGLSMNDAMIDALLVLFTVVEDTNVLSRAGRSGLDFLRAEAHRALAVGGMASAEGREAILAMDKTLSARNISPGGCADLLALTVFLELLATADNQLNPGGKP